MVLAIGIVVDDAIVVIENVERIMTEEGLSPRRSHAQGDEPDHRRGGRDHRGAGGGVRPERVPGRQRRRDLQAVRADHRDGDGRSRRSSRSASPRRCARRMLKPTARPRQPTTSSSAASTSSTTGSASTYVGHIGSAITHAPRWMIVFAAAGGAVRLPVHAHAGQLPARGRPGLCARRSCSCRRARRCSAPRRCSTRCARRCEKQEGFDGMMQVSGFSFVGQGENVGMAFIRLKPWDDRKVTATEFIQNANKALFGIRDAQIFVINLPTVSGLGQFGGFDMYLQDRAGTGPRCAGRGAQHAARQGRPESGADRACVRTRSRTRRSSSSTSTACRRSRWACRSATSTTRSS